MLTKKNYIKRLSLYNEGLNDVEIGRRVGVTSRAIGFWRRSLGLPSNRKVLPKDVSKSLYDKGLNDAEIAKKIGVAVHAVRYWRIHNNLPSKYHNTGKLNNPIKEICPLCGKEFTRFYSNQKYCADCGKKKRLYGNQEYFLIRNLRISYYRLLEIRPEEALEWREQMEHEEGIEFTNRVLGDEQQHDRNI